MYTILGRKDKGRKGGREGGRREEGRREGGGGRERGRKKGRNHHVRLKVYYLLRLCNNMRSSLSRFTKILIPKNSSSSSSQEIMDHEGTKQQLMQ